MLKAMKTSQTCWYCAENRRYLKCMYHWHRAAAVQLKNSDYQTAAKRFRQLLIWSRFLEDCGMLWKWILQTSSYLENVCINHQPTCFSLLLGQGGGGSGFAQQLWWDRKKNSLCPSVDSCLRHAGYRKEGVEMFGRAPCVSLPRGSEHLCAGWEGASASESTWTAEDKCSGMAGKWPCLQLFPPFVYLFFFTVLNITSLSLLLGGKCFQCLGLHFSLSKLILREKKGLSSDCWTLGRTFSDLREEVAVLPVEPICGVLAVSGSTLAVPAWVGAGRPEQALLGCCFEHHVELQQCPVSLLLSPSAWQLPEKFGWAAWLCLLHLSNPLRVWLSSCIPFHLWQRWDGYTARCSLVRQQ